MSWTYTDQHSADPAVVCQRLAETQMNLPVPITAAERGALRDAAQRLRSIDAIDDLNATDRLDLLHCLWTVLRPAEGPHVHPAEYPRLRRLEAWLQRAEYDARQQINKSREDHHA